MISVCMATFNGGKYIREQVASILEQISGNDEIVVSDDGSTDDTLEVLNSFHDARIRICKGPRKGIPYNFENAISHAKGEYIFISDQDDVWAPNKVERMVEALQNVDLVVSDAWVSDKFCKSTGVSLYDMYPPHKGFWPTIYHTNYIGCCMAFKRTVLKKVLPFPPHIIGHDYWIGQIADLYYDTCFIPDKLMYYRRHGDNASTFTTGKSPLPLWKKLRFRFWIVFYTLRRCFS